MARFVKVDLTEEECEAVHTLCDLARTMLDQVGSTVPARARETLLLKLNSVRFKMGASAALFGGQNILTPNMLPIDLAARNRKN